MRFAVTAAERSFRDEVRGWLADNAPRAPRPDGGDAQRAYDTDWRRRQYEGGWGHVSWPTDYGGRGLSVAQQLIWHEEYARARAPTTIDTFFVALNHAGPTLIARGNERQKAYHLPRILTGEDIWCQGFSEPGAGSDLASLTTRGVVDGDSLVVTGQKTWTTNAHVARYQELLVRTDPQAKRHAGLTWIIAEMGAPGMTVRPIRNLLGEEHFCEVFYDEVRVPLANIVGGLDNGWSVAMSTLAFERGVASVAHVIHLEETIERLIALATARPGWNGRPAITDEAVASELAQLRADGAALRSFAYRAVGRSDAPGADPSILRLTMAELGQRADRLAMEVLGAGGLALGHAGGWAFEYLSNLRHTIAGGTAEIQRTLIGERGLGLPRGAR